MYRGRCSLALAPLVLADAAYVTGRTADEITAFEVDDVKRCKALVSAQFCVTALLEIGQTWECALKYAENLQNSVALSESRGGPRCVRSRKRVETHVASGTAAPRKNQVFSHRVPPSRRRALRSTTSPLRWTTSPLRSMKQHLLHTLSRRRPSGVWFPTACAMSRCRGTMNLWSALRWVANMARYDLLVA